MAISRYDFGEFSKNGRGEVLATDDGLEWLQEHQSFVEIMAEFTNTQLDPVKFLKDYPEVDYVGYGSNSTILRVDDKALKVASPFSGRDSEKSGRPHKPEDLFRQLSFSVLLAKKLGGHDESEVDDGLEGADELEAHHGIMTPKQYFAIHSPIGNLKLEELILPDKWSTIGFLAAQGDFTKVRRLEINEAVKSRIREAVGRTMTMAMDFGQTLPNHNILVPNEVRPETGPLCIIDQPSNRLVGRLIASLLLNKHL